MEEKKTLWIVLLVSFFVLVVFGSAMLLHHHPKTQNSSEEELQYFREISESQPSEKVDPDLWSRELEKVPDYEGIEEADSTTGKGSITFVDGASVENGKSYIDVSDLDSNKANIKEGKKLPEEVAKQLGVDEKKEEAKSVQEEKPRERALSNPKISAPKKVEKKEISSSVVAQGNNKRVEERNNPQTDQIQYWVQIASLSSKLNAEKARDKLASHYMKAEIFTKETATGLTHRVRVGPFKNNTEAEYWLKSIKGLGGFESSYISQVRVGA